MTVSGIGMTLREARKAKGIEKASMVLQSNRLPFQEQVEYAAFT